jgi:hypothetical protein
VTTDRELLKIGGRLLRRWLRHHDGAKERPCDDFDACSDIEFETEAFVREIAGQTRSAPRPSKRRRSGGRIGGASGLAPEEEKERHGRHGEGA